MNKLLLLGCLYSDTQKEAFYNKSKKGYQFAAQKFQEALIDGFLSNDVDLTVITIPSLSTYPFGYKELFVKSCDFIYKDKNIGVSKGFINLPLINRPCKKSTIKEIETWYKKCRIEDNKCIVIYGLHLFQLNIASEFKRSHRDVSICVVVPDLPEYMGCNKYYRKLGLKERQTKAIYHNLTNVDSFVLLSDKMMERLPVKRPYVVVEGIIKGVPPEIKDKGEIRSILYTGGVYKRYGIQDLVEAFEMIKYNNYRLLICGSGDAVDFIKEASSIDSRISYLGVLPSDEIASLQKNATLLVNPRHSNEVFTDYSFPSKTMEYLLSGTPTVMCHLGCIPSDYDEHLFYFEDESLEGMKDKLVEICEENPVVLRTKGEKAAFFILNHKNPKVQVKKILDLIGS